MKCSKFESLEVRKSGNQAQSAPMMMQAGPKVVKCHEFAACVDSLQQAAHDGLVG
jgi:hypothetical protein